MNRRGFLGLALTNGMPVTIMRSPAGQPQCPQTAAERTAGVMPVNCQYEQGNVFRYGAKGDGVSDDSTAVGSAIDVATRGGGSSYVYFPAATYLITNRVSRTLGASTVVNFCGDRGRTEIKSAVICASTIELYNAQLFTSDGVNYTGNGKTGAAGNGHAIALRALTPKVGTYFPQECDIDHGTITGFRGNDLDDTGATITAAAIYMDNGLANYVDRVSVRGCGQGVYFDKSANSFVRGATISDCDKWGIRFELCIDGMYVKDSDINGNGQALGVHSETVNGISIPYGAVFANACTRQVVISNTKMKNNVANIAADLCDEVNVVDVFSRMQDTSRFGWPGIWVNRSRKLNVRGGTSDAVPTVSGTGHHTAISVTAGDNDGELSVNIDGHLIIPGDTLEDGIHVDGHGSSNQCTVNITCNSIGDSNAAANPRINNCVRLSNGTFNGRIEGNTFVSGVKSRGRTGAVIVNTLFIDTGTNAKRVRIAHNTDDAYLYGSIKNPTLSSENSGVITGTTDGGGYIEVTHGLIEIPRVITLTVKAAAAYVATYSEISTTTFRVQVFNTAAVPLANTKVAVSWRASIS